MSTNTEDRKLFRIHWVKIISSQLHFKRTITFFRHFSKDAKVIKGVVLYTDHQYNGLLHLGNWKVSRIEQTSIATVIDSIIISVVI